MPSYRFITEWRIEAPVERVWEVLADSQRWPQWWPSVRRVEQLEPGDDDGLGEVQRMTFVAKLPYQLRFDLRVIRRESPTVLVGEATGELEGTGEWTMREEDGWTSVRYVWAIRTTAPWINLLAPLPFVSEIFGLNHHHAMRIGLKGIRRRLGGVAGRYTLIQ